MSWLLALVLRPFVALLVFGLAAFLAIVVFKPMIPDGRIKTILYDRTIQKQHPWKFALLFFVVFYGVIGLIGYVVWTH